MSHPSSLKLEQLLAGQSTPDLTSHVLHCERCRADLARMEAEGKRFSSSPRSLRAREAANHADRQWKRRAAAFTVIATAALAALTVGVTQLVPRDQPATPKDQLARPNTPANPRRQAREVLEPRPETWPSRMRKISLRGRDVEFGQGSLEAATADGQARPFTLKHTKVDITISGFMQAVQVTQTFQNPFNTPVEAVYVFPLPDDSAVHAMELKAGNRVITAEVKKRGEARREYEQAKAEGRRAALLDQERPNVFTQSIANLLPGETVEVTLSYVAPLAYDDGVYTLNFPMVVGPRYIPGAALPGESQGTGTAQDTDQVLDASRITPPTARSGRDIEIAVHLDAGTVIEDLWSVSHKLEVDRPSSSRMELDLDPYDTLPNKDLIVRWRVSGQQARAAMMAAGGAFALMLNPESSKAALPPTPKEMVFVIDTSCSMNGPPLAAAKLAMEQALAQMNPLDTFMLIDFADRASSFHDSPLPASPDTVQRAVSYLRSLPAAGGTNQLAGIRRALGREEDPSRVRMVLFMTDGFIGNEEEILAETRRIRGNARVFGFGIGSSVNHYLLSRLSDEGRGFYQYVRPDEDPTDAVNRFVKRVRRPLITDLKIDFGALPVVDVMPGENVPDLFDAQPLFIQGRYRNAATGTVMLHGKRAGKEEWFEVPVVFPEPSAEPAKGKAMTMAWARRRIEQLSKAQYGSDTPEVVEQISSLGLEYHLVTKYTSLVATEKTPVTNVPSSTVTEPTLAADQTVEVDGKPALQYKRMNTIQIIRGSGVNGAVGGEGGLGMKGVGVGGGGTGGLGGLEGGSVGTLGSGYVGGGRGKGGGGAVGGDVDGRFDNDGDDFAYAFGGGSTKKPEPTPVAKPPTSPANPPTPKADPKDFVTGGTIDTGGSRPRGHAGYIPPAPGGGGVVDSLGQSDIMQVIIANKGALAACTAKKEAGTSGKIVLKWWVALNGKVTKVELADGSEDFKGTPMAQCFAGAIKAMIFPAHRTQHEAIVFPFKF